MLKTEIASALALYFLKALPHTQLARLLRALGAPSQILCSNAPALRDAGLKDSQIEAVLRYQTDSDVQQQVEVSLQWLEASPDRHIVVLTDPQYPPLLREIHDPPPLLFVHGQTQALLQPQIAMIGSRRCSVDGKSNARRFAGFLAEQGFCICSGMARGIDTCAHAAALAANGATLAVLGTGVDVIYPKSNGVLAEQIIERGALISELPLGSKAIASHFPKRNRIISGMSAGVIVVEAALRSGSLITARMALEHNRELFAIPSSIRNPLSVGCHRLIQQGAGLIDAPEQVLEQLDSLLGSQFSLLLQTQGKKTEQETSLAALGREAKCVIRAMGYDPVSLDIIVERSELPIASVQTHLLRLELDGHIRNHLGRYVLCDAIDLKGG